VNRLQDVSSKAEETSKAGAGNGESLVGTRGWDGGWCWCNGNSTGANSRLGWCSDGGVRVDGRGNYAGGNHWLDYCAWAVGDGQGGGLGDSVGDTVESQLGSGRADSGVCGENLSDIGCVTVC